MNIHHFDRQDLFDIVNGAALLGCGGGGDIITAGKILDEILGISETVEYIDPEESAAESDLAAVFGVMGSPIDLQKQSMSGACQRAYELMKAQTKERFIYPMSIETGAVNSLIPILLSVKNNIPFIDGDGGGRAFPMLTMCTFAGYKINPSPAILVTAKEVNEGGCNTIVDAGSSYEEICCIERIEEMTRSIVSSDQFNGIGAFALFPMKYTQMQNSIVKKTYKKCLRIGKLIRENKDNPVPKVVEELKGKLLCTGRITKIEQTTSGGFDYGIVHIKNIFNDEMITVLNVNENFLVWSSKSSSPIAIAPELICYITPEGQALTNVDVREGMNICLISFKTDSHMHLNKDLLRRYHDICEQLGYHGIFDLTKTRINEEERSFMKIKIVMPVATDEFNQKTLEEAQKILPVGTLIDVENIKKGSPQIESLYDEAINSSEIISLCKKAEKEKYDGVFISCMGDPAIEAAREVTEIPVVAPCRIACSIAAELSDRFSIITVVPSIVHAFEILVRENGLSEFLASVKYIDIPVSDLLDSDKLLEKLVDSSVKAILHDGAKSIVLGCTGILGMEEMLARELKNLGYNVPVIYPVSVSLKYLELLISCKLTQSKATYMYPPEKGK